jgi:benzylsuccinate CoA-transferase BbsF subunit
MTGWYDLTGFEDGEPLGPYSAYTDFLSWPHFLAAILIALEQRDTRGTVARIDHAQIESSIHFIAPLLLDHELNHAFPTRSGNHNADFAPSNAYRCSGGDRWIAITARSDDQWKHVARVLGLDSAANGFAHLAGRKANEPGLDALVTSQTQSRDASELAAELQSAGVPAAAVARAQDLFDDPQLAHRSVFRRLAHEVLGDHAVLGASFKLEGLSPGPFQAAPLLGEHTFEIASQLLALDDEAISALVEAGVLR